MRKFITAMLLGITLLVTPAFATPPVPKDAALVNQRDMECQGETVLRYEYSLPNGEALLVFKRPNGQPHIYIRFNADEQPVEVYVGERKMDFMELLKEYQEPCDAFKAA